MGGVKLDGLGAAWHSNPVIRDRMSEDGSSGVILPPEGEKIPVAIQETAVCNEMFIIPVALAMKAAQTLKIPTVEMFEQEFEALWLKYFEAKQKRSTCGRMPQLPKNFVLPPYLQAVCHADAKHLKCLMSMVRKQFLRDRTARESWYK